MQRKISNFKTIFKLCDPAPSTAVVSYQEASKFGPAPKYFHYQFTQPIFQCAFNSTMSPYLQSSTYGTLYTSRRLEPLRLKRLWRRENFARPSVILWAFTSPQAAPKSYTYDIKKFRARNILPSFQEYAREIASFVCDLPTRP